MTDPVIGSLMNCFDFYLSLFVRTVDGVFHHYRTDNIDHRQYQSQDHGKEVKITAACNSEHLTENRQDYNYNAPNQTL